MSSRRRRAIALMLTLIVTTLLLMLVSAFFVSNTDQIRLQRQSELGHRATAAALSGLEYARMRLEADPLWGRPEQGRARNRTIPGLAIQEVDDFEVAGVKTFVCVGVLADQQSHFQINLVHPPNLLNPLVDLPSGRVSDLAIAQQPQGTIGSWNKELLPRSDLSINYLAAGPFSPPLQGEVLSPGRTLVPGQALLQVRGYCRGTVRTLEVNFGGERQTESSVQAGGALAMDFDTTLNPNARWSVQSILWDKNRIESGGKMVLGGGANAPRLRFDHLNKGEAASQADIQVSPGIQSVAQAPDGTLTTVFQAPPTDVNLEPAQNHANGKLSPNSGVSGVTDLSKDAVESSLSQANYQTVNLPGGDYRFTSHDTIQMGGTTYSGEMRQGGVQFATIRDHKLTIREGFRLDFSGSTTIRSMSSITPSVLVGYHPDGWLPWNSKGSFLKVSEGNLTIRGSLSGAGAVMTTGNSTTAGTISLQGKSQMSSDPDSGVTMFAERNILVGAPDPSSAEFFHFDLAAISQGMVNYVDQSGASWNEGTRPLNRFADLASDQDIHTQGGSSPVDDLQVSASSIKTAPVTQNLSDLKAQMLDTFPVLSDAAALAEFEHLYDYFLQGDVANGVDPGMSVGRYLRLREFARELQSASDRSEPLPTSDLSSPEVSLWAQLDKRNGRLNDQLKAEIAYFHRKSSSMGDSLRSLITAPNAKNPNNNPLTSEMNARDARWTGLMYARGSVWLDSGGGRLDVRGSLVARHDVAVTNSTGVTTVYDPRYLNGLTRFSIANREAVKLVYNFYRVR